MKKSIVFIIAITLIAFNVKSYAQTEESKTELPIFGLGMHIEQFKLNDITTNINTAPANKVIFTISPTNHFRIESEIGFNAFNDKEDDLSDLSIHFGVGGFVMFQKGKTNIYTGLRVEYAAISHEYIDWSPNPNQKQTEKTKRISAGPAIGAEFFLGKHFSFGGEIALKYMNLKSEDSQYSDSETVSQSYITTDSGLLVRFYF